MGSLRFRVERRDEFADPALERIYAVTIDESPWLTRVRWEDDLLIVDRSSSDSCYVRVPWKVNDRGEYLLSTTCLMERDTPYRLEIELARGLANQVRGQRDAWEQAGLVVPESVQAHIRKAVKQLAAAATCQESGPAAEHAVNSIDASANAVDELVSAYTEQVHAARRKQGMKMTRLLAINLGQMTPNASLTRSLKPVFSAAKIPFLWKQIEAREGVRDWKLVDRQIQWCQRNGFRVCGGPVIQLSSSAIPDWLFLWEGDFENIVSVMQDYLRTVVERYKGKVQVWTIVDRINHGKILSMNEQERMRLVVGAIQTVREIDTRTPIIIGIDQPWGEYLARQDSDLTPLGFADTLLRADLGLSGIALDINTAYHPDGSMRHGLLEYSRLLDRWSLLGVPLLVSLRFPGMSEPPASTGANSSQSIVSSNWTLDRQREHIERFVPLMLSKNNVQIVVWNQLADLGKEEFPGSGLFDARGNAKPALAAIRNLRETYLS